MGDRSVGGVFFSALLALTTLLIAVSFQISAIAQAPSGGNSITDVYFFHTATCPYCRQQEPLMDYIDDTYPQVRLRSYEIEDFPDIWQEVRSRYGITSGGVPRTFIGDRSFIGYSEDDGPLQYQSTHQGYIGYRNQIIAAIEAEAGIEIRLPEGALSPRSVPWWLLALPALYTVSYPVVQSRLRTPESRRLWTGGTSSDSNYESLCLCRPNPRGDCPSICRPTPLSPIRLYHCLCRWLQPLCLHRIGDFTLPADLYQTSP